MSADYDFDDYTGPLVEEDPDTTAARRLMESIQDHYTKLARLVAALSEIDPARLTSYDVTNLIDAVDNLDNAVGDLRAVVEG